MASCRDAAERHRTLAGGLAVEEYAGAPRLGLDQDLPGPGRRRSSNRRFGLRGRKRCRRGFNRRLGERAARKVRAPGEDCSGNQHDDGNRELPREPALGRVLLEGRAPEGARQQCHRIEGLFDAAADTPCLRRRHVAGRRFCFHSDGRQPRHGFHRRCSCLSRRRWRGRRGSPGGGRAEAWHLGGRCSQRRECGRRRWRGHGRRIRDDGLRCRSVRRRRRRVRKRRRLNHCGLECGNQLRCPRLEFRRLLRRDQPARLRRRGCRLHWRRRATGTAAATGGV